MITNIHKHWKIKKLGEIANISSGTTPFRKNPLFYDNADIPWVKTTDLNNSYITTTEEKVSMYALNNTSLRLYPTNTVLVAMYGGFNQIGRTGKLAMEATINQALSALVLKNDDVNSDYLLFWLNANVEKWKRFAGSSRKDPNINGKDVAEFSILIPPLEEQEKIAEILLTCDKAIRLTTQIITQLKQRNQGLAQQLLTGEKSNYKAIGKYIKEISNRNSNLQVKKVLSVTNSKGFINQSEQFGRELASSDVSNYKIVSKGQFAYNPSRVNVGSIDLLQDSEMGILSPMYIVFETKEDYLLSKFLYYHLKSNSFLVRIPTYVQGSVRDTLSFKALSEMEFFIPNIEKQKKVTKILDTAHQELKLYEQKLQLLQAQKKTLMQKLLTGEVLTVKK